MQQEQPTQQQQKPDFLAWVRELRTRASGPEAEDGGRTWVPLAPAAETDDP